MGKPFEPWYPFLWTDGSIGAINTAGITANDVKALYGNTKNLAKQNDPTKEDEDPTGSNGFAFSPKITQSGNAILYINPHVTFYFRPEVHMVSEEGLNAYGAVTWGQFFVYQGFNEHCGWMHTSSDVDAADSYIEKLTQKNGKWFYEYNKALLPVKTKKITLPTTTNGEGLVEENIFTILYTHHGPVMAKKDGQYLSVRADNRIMNGLIQCWQRTKATSFAAFKKTLDLEGNISNNTVYADAEGNIAYWHGNRIPKRDPKYNWSQPVDGSTSATEWKGYHPIAEIVQCINPPNGWLQNCNSTPYTVAGINSPKKNNYPAYMAPDAENFRGLNAVRILNEGSSYTIDKVIAAGYDRRLSAFEVMIPALVRAYETSNSKTDYSFLSDAINILKAWDYRSGELSVATTLAVSFAEKLSSTINQVVIPGEENAGLVEKTKKYFAEAKGVDLLNTFSAIIDELKKKYGNWNTTWGEINRFQRISSDIDNKFDDSKPSIPVGFVSSTWGMLPSYSSRSFPGTKERYGVNGNSFICAVEFVRKGLPGGKKVKAKSLLAGGESGDPASPHFFDQGLMYSKGQFKDVLFYKDDVMKHMERSYHPGE
jgi:acyl-homoserine lactone acylase PvdQ